MTHLSDRMPTVAHGRETWSHDDLAHLEGCEACQSEWTLIDRATRLGSDIEDHFDLDVVTGRVTERMADTRQGRRFRFQRARWFVPLAAAASLVIVFSRGQPAEPAVDTDGLAVTVLLPELELLTEDDLELVFDVVPATANPLEQGIPGVSDLGEEELERLLQILEG